MCPKIRCDGESKKFCKIFWELNRALLWTDVCIELKMVLFIWLIIRLIQLVFSAGTIFFSHKKSANSVFQPAYNSSRTAPISYVLLYSIWYSSNSILFREWLICSFHHMWTKNSSTTLNPISYTLSHDLWWPINLTPTRNINTQI
jgi:hypothetical protein